MKKEIKERGKIEKKEELKYGLQGMYLQLRDQDVHHKNVYIRGI